MLVAIERWATQDPQQAFEKVAKSTDLLLKEQGIARVLNFAAVCPDAAKQWVEQLPAGSIRESAIGTYVEAASMWHPEAAARLALKTTDSVARQQRVEHCFRLWLTCDPDSAREWLKEANLTEEQKRSLLSQKPSLEF